MGVRMSAQLAIAITRWWTRVYTLGLRAELRDARCAEIESDLWESLHDPDVTHAQILPRLAGGLLDDLSWRANHLADESRMMALTVATGSLLLIAMWEWLARPAIMTMMLESIWLYPIVQSAHVLGITVFLGLSVMLDLRTLGFSFREVRASEVAAQTLPWVAVSGLSTLVTGMLLFLAEPSRFVANPFFAVKAVALVLAAVNLLVFHLGVYSRVAEWDDTGRPPLAARASAVFSLTLWAIVLIASRFVAYAWFS
jgi:hypothetical protein